MPVKAISSTTAMPAPITMPQKRWRPCRPRQAIAMTSALSPDNSTLIQMIFPTASQKAGCCMSACSCMKNAPRLAGSNACSNKITARPLSAVVRQSADDLVAREELRDLDRGGVGRVRTMHRILADRLRMQLADGTVGRLGRIGRAHHLAVLGDRALAFQHLHDNGAGGHEVHQLAKERTSLVHGVEGLGLLAGHANALLRNDAKPRLLDQRVDGASEIALGGVRLDDREGAFNRHVVSSRSAGGVGSCGLISTRPADGKRGPQRGRKCA